MALPFPQPKRLRPDNTADELVAAQEVVEEAYDKLGESLAALRHAIDERKSAAPSPAPSSPSRQPKTPASRKDRR